ncbi:MAG: helix-turn-helix domain-containing protein [Clostridia bacterium]|nr:helix-turn-helix domain-containing protein [Clostridia bacterium]
MERTFYSCQEVADRYGVKISTVWAWVREKKLPAIKIGKIYKVRKEDLEKFETQNLTVAT